MGEHKTELPSAETKPQSRPSFGRALLWMVFTSLVLVGLILWLTPAAARAENLLKLVGLLASWPVVVGAIIVGIFVSFGDEISTYIKNVRLKYGELELTQLQPSAPLPVLEAVRDKEAGQPNSPPLDVAPPILQVRPAESAIVEMKEHLLGEVRKREEEALKWKHLYLDSFLVDRSKSVLLWIASFRGRIPKSFFNGKWEKFFPTKSERAQTLRLLSELGLLRIENNQISVTTDGRRYLEHLGIVAEETGQNMQWPHPFISRDEVEQFSSDART